MSGKFGSVKVHILFKLFLFSILTTILNYIFQQKWRETEKKMATDQVKLMEFRFIIFFFASDWDNARDCHKFGRYFNSLNLNLMFFKIIIIKKTTNK